jgi:hypothetical protein
MRSIIGRGVMLSLSVFEWASVLYYIHREIFTFGHYNMGGLFLLKIACPFVI